MDKTKAIERVNEEIAKIDKNENKVFFFVYDTKGNPNGSIEYIYNLALIAKENGYNVAMLHQEEEFVGVGEWLGEDYASLDHFNVAKDSVEVTPSDILFIPEIFASVMNQTKKLPCKRIAILQNYDYVCEEMPFASQWGNFGIMEAIVNTKNNSELIKDIFPYIKTKVIPPFIDKRFGDSGELRNMIVNIIAKRPEDVNRIVKPFYWKYPTYKWVSFRDLRNLPKDEFAKALRENAITIWVDDETGFGFSALEAIKSGSIVIAKIPDNNLEWMSENNSDTLKNCCVWFDNIRECHKQIASVIRAWITDSVPEVVYDEAKRTSTMYPRENTEKAFTEYLKGVINNRRKELETILKIEEK